ncbi:hypothetical protein ACR2XN_29255, partial [Klebsiella pneumoniae]
LDSYITRAELEHTFQARLFLGSIMWIMDSGCSRHMTGDRALLSNVVDKAGPVVTFGDNSKGMTKGHGYLVAWNAVNNKVSFVEGLKHYLLRIDLSISEE